MSRDFGPGSKAQGRVARQLGPGVGRRDDGTDRAPARLDNLWGCPSGGRTGKSTDEKIDAVGRATVNPELAGDPSAPVDQRAARRLARPRNGDSVGRGDGRGEVEPDWTSWLDTFFGEELERIDAALPRPRRRRRGNCSADSAMTSGPSC